MTTQELPAHPGPTRYATSWRERSSSTVDQVMEEIDAFGIPTGNTRVDSKPRRVPVNPRRRPDGELSPLPADPPIVIYRTRVPWGRVAILSATISTVITLTVELVK